MKDKGKGAENLIWLAGRQSGRADPALLAADDILAALTGRIAELEARVSEILAEVDPERPSVNSNQRGALSTPKPDASRGTDKIRDAHVGADAELARASDERRMLANEMRLLREAFQEAHRSQLPAGPGANAAEAQIVPDLQAAIADEMRSLLTELLADARVRVLAPRPVEHVPARSEPTVPVVAAAPPIVEEVVEDLTTAPAVVDVVATEPPAIAEHVDTPTTDLHPAEAAGSIVEHVDELVRPTSNPLIDNSVETLAATEPAAPAGVFPVEAEPAQPAAAIVDEYEEFFHTESPPPIDTVDFEVAAPEPAAPIVDEPVFGPAEPLAPIIDEYVEELPRPETPPFSETLDVGPAPAKPTEPIVDGFVEELLRPEPPLVQTIELTAAPAEPIEPILDEYVLEQPRNEFTDPIVDEYLPSAGDITTPSAPPSIPDPRLAALWDAAPFPTEPQATPLPPPEPASFITDEFIAETRPLEVAEEPYPPQELAPEQTIEYVPPPLEVAPPAPIEFAPEPPAMVEPQREVWAEPLITEPEPAPSFSSLYPELTVADERGLRQIQVVISPIHSFPRLLETERRIRALSTVNALHLRDFRNGVATLNVSVGEAISPAEFGAVIQMLESLHLRLEGTTGSSVELRAEEEPTT